MLFANLCGAATRWWRGIVDDPGRLQANLAATPYDSARMRIVAAYALAFATKALLAEHLPWLALRGFGFTACMLALALQPAQRPAAFAAWREPLVLLLALLGLLMLTDGALHGGTNFLEWHRGSPALLLALLSVYNGGLWLFSFSIIANLPRDLNTVALPLLAAVPALASPALCRRLLEVPGAVELLASLHSRLGALHSLVTPPLGIAALHSIEPAPQCLAVSNWSLAVLGCVAPLTILDRLQSRRAHARALAAVEGEPLPHVHLASAIATSAAVWCALLALA